MKNTKGTTNNTLLSVGQTVLFYQNTPFSSVTSRPISTMWDTYGRLFLQLNPHITKVSFPDKDVF